MPGGELVTVRYSGFIDVVSTGMTNEKTTREIVYETNRDVKWICRELQRIEAQDEEFEMRFRALEGWQAETGREEWWMG